MKGQKKADVEEEVSSKEEPLAQRETLEINILRAVVALLLVSIAIACSILVFRYAKNVEEDDFQSEYRTNAQSIIDSFHDSVERRLGAINSLSTAMTSYALATNSSFPFVTLPDFELRGSDTRIQADALIIHWLPLVSDENRDEWEAYALRERGHIDRAFAEDKKRRTAQDSLYGISDDDVGGARRFVVDAKQDSEANPRGEATIQQRRIQEEEPFPGTVEQDGSGFHSRIWSNGPITPRGDEANNTGPYLPTWQRSPINGARQKALNLNFATTKLFSGIVDVILNSKQAVMNRAVIPTPSGREKLKANLAISQYRHVIDEYLDDPITFLAYPVFDTFDDSTDTREVAGVLATNVYWKLFFSRILPHSATGYICVLENSFDQTLTYRVDGHDVIYLGEGDLHDERYDHLEEFADINEFVQSQASPETRSFTTVPLNKQFGQYQLRIYPTQETQDAFTTNRPALYTTAVLLIFFCTTVVLLCLDRAVARRQRIVVARAIRAAEETATAEREINEFLAHEVRNPIAAALSAHGFVNSALNSNEALTTDKRSKSESLATLREDVRIIGSCLYFVDDFLRSILDLYRANANRIEIHLAPADLLKDVLEPISSILYQRSGILDVSVDCPENVIVMTDKLRLKQVMMNLGRNSIKFTTSGFVKFQAAVVDGLVELYVSDSGCGIPASKRGDMLFEKFQASLDSLSQGTGVGLSLCKSLVQLLQGEICLDETYDSGVPDSPGARFVIKLNVAPMPVIDAAKSSEFFSSTAFEEGVIPENLSVLFVDDDSMLRKLFTRAIKRVAPSWKISQAANGESALRLVDEGESFDIIFLDQYMASTEKQLLGSETARCLRERGVACVICGLSANDLETVFLEAGADCFQLKPFPCKREEMEQVLVSILQAGNHRNGGGNTYFADDCKEDEKIG